MFIYKKHVKDKCHRLIFFTYNNFKMKVEETCKIKDLKPYKLTGQTKLGQKDSNSPKAAGFSVSTSASSVELWTGS